MEIEIADLFEENFLPFGTCEICCEKRVLYLVNEKCHHQFCENCIKESIKFQASSGEPQIFCMMNQCKQKVSREIFNHLFFFSYTKKQMSKLSCLLCKICHKLIFYMKKNEAIPIQCIDCKIFHDSENKQMWKLELSSDELQKVIQLRDLGIMRCPNCNIWVEKIQGCDHMTCKCNFKFCYLCGGQVTQVNYTHKPEFCAKNGKFGYWFTKQNTNF